MERASLFSVGSIASIVSVGSIGSVTSVGSIASLASVGSIASIGSVGSVLSVGGARRPARPRAAAQPRDRVGTRAAGPATVTSGERHEPGPIALVLICLGTALLAFPLLWFLVWIMLAFASSGVD